LVKKFAFGAVLAACFSVVALAAAPGGGAPGGGPGGPGGPGMGGGRRGGGAGGVPAGLQPAMTDMNRTLAKLKTESADPAQSEATLRDIVTFERDVAIAALNLPPMVTAMADAEKAKATEAYLGVMRGLMRTLLDLEDAVVAKKPDDIKKLIAKMEETEAKGHAEFRPARGGRGGRGN